MQCISVKYTVVLGIYDLKKKTKKKTIYYDDFWIFTEIYLFNKYIESIYGFPIV